MTTATTKTLVEVVELPSLEMFQKMCQCGTGDMVIGGLGSARGKVGLSDLRELFQP